MQYDEWDIPRYVSSPCYPLPRPCVGGVSGRRVISSEEWAAAENRRQEVCEEIRKDYERRLEEDHVQSRRQRGKKVQDRLKFLHLCQKTPGTERRDLSECVYLMWCPSLGAYKIGHTDCSWRRFDEHRRDLDPQIEYRVTYYTPLSRQLLERSLLNHFDAFRILEDINEELFDLPQCEADGFETTAREIERHLLANEKLRLKTLFSKFEAESREAG